jgi:hypothetical protein
MSSTPTETKAVRSSPWLGFAKLLVPALIGALGAYQTASSGAKEATDVAKNKAEAGFQEARAKVEELTKSQATALAVVAAVRSRLDVVERDLRLCQRRARGASTRVPVATPLPVPPLPPPPTPSMSPDLDTALRAQQKAAAAPPAKDGGQ